MEKMQHVIDENKDSIPDGVYLKLCDTAKEVFEENQTMKPYRVTWYRPKILKRGGNSDITYVRNNIVVIMTDNQYEDHTDVQSTTEFLNNCGVPVSIGYRLYFNNVRNNNPTWFPVVITSIERIK